MKSASSGNVSDNFSDNLIGKLTSTTLPLLSNYQGFVIPVQLLAEVKLYYREIFNASDFSSRRIDNHALSSILNPVCVDIIGGNMLNMFLDESGEACFNATSAFKHLLIAIVHTNDNEGKKIKNRLQHCFADCLYNKGWDKAREVKAATVFNNPKFGAEASKKILTAITGIESFTINYIVVNKENISSEQLRKAPYGIVYNYFSGLLLTKIMFEEKIFKVNLIFDRRNKETHENKPFKEYLQTLILGAGMEKQQEATLLLVAEDSQNCFGLKAADFCAWALFRKFEHKDPTFYDLLSHKISKKSEWYLQK